MARAQRDPIDELDALLERSTAHLEEVMEGMALDILQGRPLDQRIQDLARALADSQMYADLLGRRRVILEAGG